MTFIYTSRLQCVIMETMTLEKTGMVKMSFFRPFVSLLMAPVNHIVHASVHWWGKHKIEDGLYANNLQNPPPFLDLGTTLKTDVSVLCCTVKVHISSGCLGVSLNKKNTPKILKVMMAHILCILALLCFASCVAENIETEQRYKDLQLQQDSLSWLNKFQDKQVRCFYFTW